MKLEKIYPSKNILIENNKQEKVVLVVPRILKLKDRDTFDITERICSESVSKWTCFIA